MKSHVLTLLTIVLLAVAAPGEGEEEKALVLPLETVTLPPGRHRLGDGVKGKLPTTAPAWRHTPQATSQEARTGIRREKGAPVHPRSVRAEGPRRTGSTR